MSAPGRGKVVLVTGASTGIGEAIAMRLAGEGYSVYGTSRKGGRTKGGIELLPLDVCSDESVKSAIGTLVQREARIDAVINNAGYLVAGASEETSMEEAKAQFETNFFGVVRVVNAVLPHMRAAGQGYVLATSSLAGSVPVPFWGFYNASKFALEGYLETLRYDVAPFGIKVAMVKPGAIKTPFYQQPEAARLKVYSPWRERMEKTMRGFEEAAPGPDLVAKTFSKILRQKNPALRHRVTREASIFSFLRWLLPASVYESATRQGFNLDKVGYEAPRLTEAGKAA